MHIDFKITAGCSASVDVWGIQWPSTAAGSTSTYDCYMSKGINNIILYTYTYSYIAM